MNSTVSSPDMSSVEVLHTQNDSGSFPSNDFSLLPDADQPTQNGEVDHHLKENFNLTNMRSSFNASMPDSSIDVQAQLNELVLENNRLKENLTKNNSLMEAQIVTIQSWRDHMLASKNLLEENLSKAKEQISLLEKENAGLLEKVTNASKVNDEQNVKTCSKCTKLDADLTAMLGMDYCSENQHLIMGWYYFNESLSENLRMICKHLEACKSNRSLDREEKYTLECFILMLQFKIAFLNGNDVPQSQSDFSLKTDEETGYEVVCKKTTEAEKIINELTENVQEKDNQLASVVKEKEELIEMKKEFETKIKEMEMALKSQYEVMTNKLKTESALTQRYRERCDNFEQQIEEYEKKLDQTRARMSDFNGSKQDDRVLQELREEVHNLQEILKLEQRTNQSDKEKLFEVMEKCEKLQVDYQRATQVLEIQLKDEKEKNEKLATCESDVKKYMEEADHQTAKLFVVQEQLIDVTAEMKRLQDELNQMKDQENIAFLKDQISSYKRDFLEMERAKNAASDELEKVKNHLEKYEKSSPRKSSRGNHDRRPSEQRDENGACAPCYECPICQFTFTSEKAAQNHINKCLEENK